ncbi:hypothetical protein ACGFIR_13610 [Micromonospora sp. NPDC049051]|uniref:hypothetical protein n=1 Tax=Micromonospora sp. NPDC049051 TaxID=3364264 RepID=UPI0037107161
MLRLRLPLLVLALLVLVCAGGYAVLRSAYHDEKDRRDLSDLTRSSPWPPDDLLIPDDLPRSGTLGWLDRLGLDIAYGLRTRDGRTVPVVWQQHHPAPDGSLADGVDCDVRTIYVCTDAGDGLTLVVTRDTDNSDPATALYLFGADQVLSVSVQGPDPVTVDDLRAPLTRTHHPSDDELLALLRRPGYQTDWS